MGHRAAEARASTSSSWRRPTTSAAPGATTPIPAAPATSRRTCTRSRSSRSPTGRTCSRSQPEILDYLQGRHRQVRAAPLHPRSTRTVDRAHWDDDEYRWHVFTTDGREFVAQFLISGAGALHIPPIPDIEGSRRLRRAGVPLRAVGPRRRPHRQARRGDRHRRQRHPDRARDRRTTSRELQLYQRTPPWVMPRPEHDFPARLRGPFAHVPGLRALCAAGIYWATRRSGHRHDQAAASCCSSAELLGKRNIRRSVTDPRAARAS